MEPVAHKGEEIAFIIKGHVKLYLNDEVLLLNPGDSVKIHHHLLVFFHYFFLNHTPSCSPYNIPT
ncbi:cupin domain-containing protein [Bacillus thuringiensis]|nr:cupin domain-containing protein [Bacillus thuringiensis]MED2909681.1 cupin domain-containing protein [Bacillus thuringiensis]